MFNIKILSKDNSPFGTDYYRSQDVNIPPAYRATHELKCDLNKAGNNSNVNLRTKVPVVITSDGRTTSRDAFTVRTYFTSLQHITADEDRAKAYDSHLMMLILSRADQLGGTLPDEPYNTNQTLKAVVTAFAATLN